MTQLELLLLGFAVLSAGTLLLLFALAFSARAPREGRSEGFGVVLIGPVPIVFRGRAAHVLLIAAAAFVLILLLMLGALA
ncbi:MAG: DUF131 domain-containing protein [Candidatus Caldarchaeales archaeon]